MNNKLKIAFAGASGTGKTTVATFLSKELDLQINPVGSRTVSLEMGFNNPYDVDAFGKRTEFQKKLLNDKMSWEMSRDRFVTDRTHLDNLTYSIMHNCVQTVNLDFITKAIDATKLYTHVVFFPIETFINVEDDKCRLNNLDYQQTYQFLLKTFIDGNIPKEKLFIVTKSNIKDRCQEVMDFIK